MILSRSHLLSLGLFLGLTGIFFLASAELGQEEGRANLDNSYMASATYIGSDQCGGCHADHYTQWQATQHTMKVRPVSEDIVIADFSLAVVSSFDIQLYHQTGTDEYYVNLAGNNHSVSWVLGSGAWKQMFMVELENSTYVLPLQWNSETAEWVLYEPDHWFDETGTPHAFDWGFGKLQQVAMNRSWEQNCAGCHVTGYTPQQNINGEWVAQEGVNLAEYNVGCEACHGPGSAHKDATTDEQRMDNIWRTNEANVCSQCHVRGNSLDGNHTFPVGMYPGDEITEHFQLDTLVWNDGVTSKSNYQEYVDWLDSGHNQIPSPGVKRVAPCVNCHTPEGAKALFANEPLTEAPADAVWQITCQACHDSHGSTYEHDLHASKEELCITCHNAANAEPPNLAHHPMYEMMTGQGGIGIIGDLRMGGAVTCTDCHMPKVAKSAVEWDVASHTFRTIEPSYSIINDMPNSCTTDCHNNVGSGSYLTHESADMVVRSWHTEISKMLDQVSQELLVLDKELENATLDGRNDTHFQQASDLYMVANFNYKLVAHEGSRGVHNFEYARSLLFDSSQKVDAAWMALELEPEAGTPVLDLGDARITYIGQALTLTPATAYDPQNTQLTYAWDLGDSTTSDQAQPSHTYTQEGAFLVTLTITDGEGESATDSLLVHVLEPSDDSALDDLEDRTQQLDQQTRDNEKALDGKVGYVAFMAGFFLALLAVGVVYMYYREELARLKEKPPE